MARHKNTTWHLQDSVDVGGASLAVLMDIRDELQHIAGSLNVLRCQNFLRIPAKLDAIKRNTTKKRRTK